MRNLIITFLISSIIFFGYYLLFNPFKLQLLYQSWDGPSIVVVARSFYDPIQIAKANTVNLPDPYFANILPLDPIFIRLFSFVGYFRSALITTQIFTLLFILAMYKLFKTIYPKLKLNWIAVPLIFFPARWFSITHIGSDEPLFLLLIVLFLYFLIKNKYLYSAIFLAFAQITRHAAIWYFLGLGTYLIFMWLTKKQTLLKSFKIFLPYLLVPLALITVNVFFYLRYGDFSFLSVFSQKASYFQFTPFDIFNRPTGGVWAESLVFNYLLYLGGVILLFKEKKYLFAFLFLVNFIPLVFLIQEDLSRIALSSLPLLYIAYYRVITNRTFQLALLLLTPAIYLFSFHFLNYNISP